MFAPGMSQGDRVSFEREFDRCTILADVILTVPIVKASRTTETDVAQPKPNRISFRIIAMLKSARTKTGEHLPVVSDPARI